MSNARKELLKLCPGNCDPKPGDSQFNEIYKAVLGIPNPTVVETAADDGSDGHGSVLRTSMGGGMSFSDYRTNISNYLKGSDTLEGFDVIRVKEFFDHMSNELQYASQIPPK